MGGSASGSACRPAAYSSPNACRAASPPAGWRLHVDRPGGADHDVPPSAGRPQGRHVHRVDRGVAPRRLTGAGVHHEQSFALQRVGR